jgi:hypothetical protein
MALLPKIERPKSYVTTPTSKIDGWVMPFTMKEQKILAIAEKSQEQSNILNAMLDIIKSCSSFDPNSLSGAEFQWVFLQIRKASTGATVDVTLKCGHCGEQVNTKIDLDEFVIMDQKELDPKVMITDTIGVKLKPLSILKIASSNNMSESDSIRLVIDYIFDDKDVYKVDDVDDKELEDFIDSMGIDAIKYIMEWIANVGSLELNKDWTCPKCNGKNNLHVGGIGDFFV